MSFIWIVVLTIVIAFAVSAFLGIFLIPILHKLKFGQTILDIGPKWHKAKKEGIPTMGGIMFIVGISAAFAIGLGLLWTTNMIETDGAGLKQFFSAVSGLIMAVCFAFVGFVDDFVKVRKKQNEGLTPNQKLILQILIIVAYFTSRILSGDTRTTITFPFLGQLDLWYFYYVVMGLGILFIVNAVNLTDGIDGLCSSVTFAYCAAFFVICTFLGQEELGLLAVAAAGGVLGFLVWNFHPAKVFMGDTGSMFLGGIVVALGLGTGCEFLMVVCGAVYLWEAISVVIQVFYFKVTHGKRLFKMTPIHHSFELRGWKEVKIVVVFTGLTVLAGLVSILLYFGY